MVAGSRLEVSIGLQRVVGVDRRRTRAGEWRVLRCAIDDHIGTGDREDVATTSLEARWQARSCVFSNELPPGKGQPCLPACLTA